jgi:RND family efflux transporter MFP subunit
MLNLWKKTSGWKLPFIGLCGLVFALVTVLGRAEAPVKEPITMPPVAPYEQSVAGIGIVEPKSELISIGTEISGIVREIHVNVGQKVAKDDLLFSLDQRDIDAQIIILEAALASAKIQAEDASVQFDLVKNIKDGRAVAKDDFNRRKFASQLMHSRIAEIEAQLEQAKTTKDRLNIKAPIDGTILDINIRLGEFAAAGVLTKPLLRMGDITTLHVRTEFDEEKAFSLKKKSAAKAYFRGDTSRAYELSFIRFEPYVSPKTNLAVAGQRVDTRVLQVIYALPQNTDNVFLGQQMDVFVKSVDRGQNK